MTKYNWTDITKEDVLKAIEKFYKYNPDFPEPRKTFLLYEGNKLPAKHIRGMAYQEHYGVEISKSDFGGGMETVKFFERLGFEVEYTGTSDFHPNKKIEESPSPDNTESEKAPYIKVAMYLQTDELKNQKAFNKILPVMKNSDADIIVFPEYCYVPDVKMYESSDILLEKDRNAIFDSCLKLSQNLGKSVIVSSHDKYDTIFSIFANANHLENETKIQLYVKHTMCGSSCLGFPDYSDAAAYIFNPIVFKGYYIGMTICYDCNHALFSRMYGMYGIDLIINSTGGNVIHDKWFKYNKVRAIENNCYTLVTMGGDGTDPKQNNYVFGFNKNGGQLPSVNLCGDSSKHNIPGGLYVYEVSTDAGAPEPDESNQKETENKNWQFKYPVGKYEDFLKKANHVTDSIYHLKVDDSNVFFLIVQGEDILKPEIVQKLLYSKELKEYSNRKYIIVNKFNNVDADLFNNYLSIVLKVRSMENFCAVLLISDNINKCYQCGKNRTAQVVKETNGFWNIDLERTSGPEAIWKNKVGMKASWRDNYEWLVENAEKIYDIDVVQ